MTSLSFDTVDWATGMGAGPSVDLHQQFLMQSFFGEAFWKNQPPSLQ